MIGALRRDWGSISFRLAFQYGMLVTVTMLVAFAITYLQTVGVLHGRVERRTSHMADQMVRRFHGGGLEAVAADMRLALSDEKDSESELLLLLDAQGRKLAGNLDRAPDKVRGAHSAAQRVARHGHVVSGYLVTRTLPDGSLLIVGEDMRDLEDLESLIARASATAGGVVLMLVIGGIFVFRQELDRHVGAIRRTASRIAAGDLRERVALSDEKDEFSLLNRDINDMLERIQSLMDGIRSVSDTIAHNLRTPLMRILVLLRSVEREGGVSHGTPQAVAAAISEIEELTVVFEKILQIAEAEAGARRRNFLPIALHALADDMLELYDAAAESRGMALAHEPADFVKVLGDRDLLAGALANLLDNAFKYAGPGAAIRIGTRASSGCAVLTVQDNGPGIPACEKERIGTRFYRLNQGLPGHGLGLASVKAVIALHGGRVQFMDAAPGLQVRIELPSYEEE